MKVLHVITGLGKRSGGTAEVVPRLCRELKSKGSDIDILIANGNEEMSEETAKAVAAGVGLKCSRHLGRRRPYFWRSKQSCREAESLVSGYDLVHIHGLWQPQQWFIASACRKTVRPYVMMPHGFLEPERLKISRVKKLLIGALVERKNLNSAAGIVATSDAEATGFVRYGLKRPVHVMPIGIDFEKYGSRGGAAKCSPSAARKRLLYFSRITPVKGLDLLAEAWRRLASFHAAWELLIVGPDDRGYSKVVEALFERLSPDGSVHFVAPVYGDSKYALLNSADAFVLPTRSENWGIAVAEAMASGLPIVCTKGAPWKCIETCGCGYWVDVSVAGICDGLSKVLSSADSVRMAMGQRGMAWVRDNLCWDRIADGVIGFYEKLLGIGSRG